MTSGPYMIDKNGNKSDARIWASEMNEEQEEDFEYYVYLRSLHAAVKAEIKRRADLRNENKTTNNQQPTPESKEQSEKLFKELKEEIEE